MKEKQGTWVELDRLRQDMLYQYKRVIVMTGDGKYTYIFSIQGVMMPDAKNIIPCGVKISHCEKGKPLEFSFIVNDREALFLSLEEKITSITGELK